MARHEENTAQNVTGPATAPDVMVPDAQARREFGGISVMTLARWDADSALNFPPPIYINGRKFRSRAALEAFKVGLLRAAIRRRGRAA